MALLTLENQRTTAIMTVIALALLSFVLAAETLKIPKRIHLVNPHITASVPGQNLESRSTCDPQKFTSCLLTFFDHFGLSNTTLPSEEELYSNFYYEFTYVSPQQFQEICRYMVEISNCAPSSDCWTIASMNQLNFPNGRNETSKLLDALLAYQSVCINDYYSVLNNWECFRYTKEPNCTLMDNENSTCADAKAYLTCYGNYYTKACNSDVGKIFCHLYLAVLKGFDSNPCNSTELDHFCDEGDSTTGGFTAAGSTITPNSTTPNTGSLNASFCSIVVSTITALAITSLKHA